MMLWLVSKKGKRTKGEQRVLLLFAAAMGCLKALEKDRAQYRASRQTKARLAS